MKDDSIYIDHILQSIGRIKSYLNGKDQQTFVDDFLTQDAVVRQLEIIGEATKRLSKKLRDANPNVPWLDMAGMRDILIHNYLGIEVELIWDTIQYDLTDLKNKLNNIKYFYCFEPGINMNLQSKKNRAGSVYTEYGKTLHPCLGRSYDERQSCRLVG
jgi:uncharacterized protein with HEPN domain